MQNKHRMTVLHATGLDLESDSNSSKLACETDLRMVQQLAEEMRGIESKIDMLAKEMEQLSIRHQQIQLQALPDLMTQVGLSEFSLITGDKIKIEDFVRASIPSQSAIDKADGPDRDILVQRKATCFAWLRQHQGESLIKTELTASFGKGQSKEAAKMQKLIIKAGYPAQLEQAVNFQTLNKFIRENLQQGIEVPAEPFALFTGKKATLARPRQAKQTR